MLATAQTKLNIIIGDPVHHSLSPLIHNAGYMYQKIDSLFVFLACNVPADLLEQAMSGVKALGINGITCTMPHKIEILKYLDSIDPVAKIIGAVNTIYNQEGELCGYNTDWRGTLDPLLKSRSLTTGRPVTSLSGCRVALFGAGGAARAMAYAVCISGGKLTLVNRTKENAMELAQDFSACSEYDIEVCSPTLLEIERFDIILNATSVGMCTGETPLPDFQFYPHQIVFDAIYQPYETQLLKDAKRGGAHIIHGTEMLLHQAFPQYEIYTHHKAPEDEMRHVLNHSLSIYHK